MVAKRLTLLFAVLVGLDLSCPLLPGALRFAAEESVEGRLSLPANVAHTPRSLTPATGPDEVVLTEPREVVLTPQAAARPVRFGHRGRSSTFLGLDASLSLVDDH